MKEGWFDKFCKWFLWAVLFAALGYAWAASVFEGYESRAERDLKALEEEFHYRLTVPPTTFLIFNGQFEVYPVQEKHKLNKRFHYRRAK